MKKVILTLMMIPLLTFGQKLKMKGLMKSGEAIVNNETTYNSNNEAYIKFKFQNHNDSNTSYKIKFIQAVEEIEFWAHQNEDSGKEDRYLSILSDDFKVDLKGTQVQEFYTRIMTNYKTYLKEIRVQKPNVHLDVNLNKEGTLIFSSYMSGLKSNNAFWLNEIKNDMSEKDFLKLMAEIRIHYDFEEIAVE